MAITDDQIRAMWRAAGGGFHGPHVEHAYMEEAKFLPFIRRLLNGEWRSMDSAPKDGTEVLVWTMRAGTMGQMVAHYTQGGGEEQPAFGPAWFYWNGHYFAECEPLLWQPLPAKPQTT